MIGVFFAAVLDDSAGGVFSVDPLDGEVRTDLLLDTGAGADPGFAAGLVPFAPLTGALAFAATTTTGRGGVFVAADATMQTVLAARVVGKRPVTIGPLAAAGERLLFLARRGRSQRTALFSWTHGRPRPVIEEGRRAPDGGSFAVLPVSATEPPFAATSRRVAMIAPVVVRRNATSGLYLAGREGIRRLLLGGRPLGDDGVLTLGTHVAFQDDDVVVEGGLVPGAESVLVRVRL